MVKLNVPIFLALLLAFVNAFAGEIVSTSLDFETAQVHAKGKNLDLIEFAEVFECADSIEVNELIKNKTQYKVETKSRYGFSENAYWIAFKTPNFAETRLLVIANPHLDYVDFYKVLNGSANLIYQTGDKRLFNNRPYPDKDFVFELNSNTSYLLKLYKHNSSISIPAQIIPKRAFIKTKSISNIANGVYFGTMFIAILVALMFGFILKKKLFAWYSLYLTCLWLYLFTHLGYSFQMLYPNSTTINSWLRLLMIVITFFVFIQFTRSYFQSKKYFKFHDRLLALAQLVFVLLFVLWQLFPMLYDEYLMIMLSLVYSLLILIIIISISLAVKARSKSRLYSRLYLGAYSAVGFFSLISILDEYGVFDSSVLFINPIMAGFGLEFIVLSVAIASKIYSSYFESKRLLTELEAKIAKEQELNNQKQELESRITKLEKPELEEVTLKINTGQLIVIEEILYATSEGHYNSIYKKDETEPVVFRGTFKELSEKLPAKKFIQVHRSYIVKIDQISKVLSNSVQLKNKKEIPVSRTYKSGLKELLS